MKPHKLVLLGHYPPSVVLEENALVLDALLSLDERGARYGAVTDFDGKLIGMISITEVLSAIRAGSERGSVFSHLSNKKVKEIMNNDPIAFIVGEFGVEEVIEEMVRRRVGAAFVTDNQGYLLGIISTRHIISLLALTPMHIAAHEVMERVPAVMEDSSISDVIDKMIETRHFYLPVGDQEGRLVGVVTARDIIDFIGRRDVMERLKEGRDKEVLATPVAKVMAGSPIFSKLDAPLDDVLRSMRKRGISAMPIVDEEYKIRGMVTEVSVVFNLPRLTGVEVFYDYSRLKLFVARMSS